MLLIPSISDSSENKTGEQLRLDEPILYNYYQNGNDDVQSVHCGMGLAKIETAMDVSEDAAVITDGYLLSNSDMYAINESHFMQHSEIYILITLRIIFSFKHLVLIS